MRDAAPNGAGRLLDCRSYKDSAPTELVNHSLCSEKGVSQDRNIFIAVPPEKAHGDQDGFIPIEDPRAAA